MISEAFKEDVYKVFLESRTIIYNEDIDDSIIEKVVMPIYQINQQDDSAAYFNRKKAPIHLYINSSGGDVTATLSAVSAIETSKTPVYTYVLGKAMSGAFFMAIAGYKRFCQKYSTLCFHQIHNQIDHSPQKSIQEAMQHCQKLQDFFTGLVVSKSNITAEKLEDVVSKKIDWMITPKEALQLGVIDSII